MEGRNMEDNVSPAETEAISEDEVAPEDETSVEQPVEADETAYQELNNRYLRLHADFDNYKKRVNKDKEELIRYSNETLLYELLPAIDNLELALKHASSDLNTGLVQGVEMTFKELHRILEKFGLSRIEAEGKQFDPAVHHAMIQVERDDMDEKLVAEELRAGYRYRDKVLRPSLVAVSVRPAIAADDNKDAEDTAPEAEES